MPRQIVLSTCVTSSFRTCQSEMLLSVFNLRHLLHGTANRVNWTKKSSISSCMFHSATRPAHLSPAKSFRCIVIWITSRLLNPHAHDTISCQLNQPQVNKTEKYQKDYFIVPQFLGSFEKKTFYTNH